MFCPPYLDISRSKICSVNTGISVYLSLSAVLCNSNLTSFLFQSKTVKMSFLFDWIYRGFSSVLQFLGKYCVQFFNNFVVES